MEVRPGTGGVLMEATLAMVIVVVSFPLDLSRSEQVVSAWSTAMLSTNCCSLDEMPVAPLEDEEEEEVGVEEEEEVLG